MAAEKNFENKVKAFLKDKGAWVLKYWGGAAYTKSGIPDLLVCFRRVVFGNRTESTKWQTVRLAVIQP